MIPVQRTLLCLASGHVFEDDCVRNEEPGVASLLRTVYKSTGFTPLDDMQGLYRYANWLPIDRTLEGSAAPVSYWSGKLAKRLGLNRLLISFNGYWPERGAFMKTGSFKECEAYSVCARFPGKSRLVVASAGNTARAFLRAASDNNIPLVIVIPYKYINSLYAVTPVADCVHVVAIGDNADYFDAIMVANKICEREGFVNEGGAKNVARRDGMGTTVLSAVDYASEIPDWYVQAIGSGTGAIAAHEANLRLNASGSFQLKQMRLLLAQNDPFTPIAGAWAQRSRTLPKQDINEAKDQIEQIDAKVLSNRNPPYGIAGGLFDALTGSEGEVDTVTNNELRNAMALFDELEGCDICPEAGAALAILIKAVNANRIDKDALVMLNITGGGESGIQRDLHPQAVKPDYLVSPHVAENAIELDRLCEKLLK